MIAFSIGRSGVDVKSAKDVQNSVYPSSTPSNEPTRVGEEKFLVTKVIDGDTIDIQVGTKRETIRIIGIDAPESGECYGNEASEKARGLLSSKSVNLERDPSQGERDRYGRLLGYVFVDGTNFQELVIREGYVKEYTYNKPYKYQSLFREAQRQASEQKKGLWSACTGLNPSSTPTPQITNNPQSSVQGSYSCDCGKLCSQIATCDEAYYQLNSCGCTKRDSDGDGVPCESLCR